ncbi:MAG: DUF2339 domain-containing protein [Candidatus Hydrogenedentes bacterium]|nr:DUF2339 domain-containing protein [Candidatus Hydrogenedentota bacterium]
MAHFRRKEWLPLFQTLTGIGIAVFYLCIFFSFHIYNLTGQSVSFGLAAVVTLLAVVMAVAHDALPIAILGVIGGFLSPVIFSAGGNHPYGLFSYVILIDLVALGAAYFRRWRALDLLCFMGTVALYQSWYVKYYRPEDQMLPALLFVSIFYILFLAIPTLYSLTRRLPEGVESLTLIAVDSLFSLFVYYNVLYRDYRYALGFVVLAQALLVFGLYNVWTVRVSRDSRTAQSLLIIALALVTLAIPIQLKLYGVPIAWAVEGVVFVWLGFRFRESIVRIGGAAALLLAAGGLVHRLPLHSLPFTPIFNLPFGSWALVIAAATGAAYLFHTRGEKTFELNEAIQWQAPDGLLAILAFLLAFILAAALLTMECALFWTTRRMENYANYQFDSLAVLWSIIPMATLWTIGAKRLAKAAPLAYVCFGLGGLVFLLGLGQYNHPTAVLALNATFLSKVVFISVLWWAAWTVPKIGLPEFERETALAFEVAGNVLLTVLLAFEFDRWSHHTDLISRRMGLALISAAWAVQAFSLIWVGLMMRKKPLRVLGFLLFGLTCGKVLLYDTNELEQIYRIVSFMATGLLLLLATWIYHRYSAALLGPQPAEQAQTPPEDQP